MVVDPMRLGTPVVVVGARTAQRVGTDADDLVSASAGHHDPLVRSAGNGGQARSPTANGSRRFAADDERAFHTVASLQERRQSAR